MERHKRNTSNSLERELYSINRFGSLEPYAGAAHWHGGALRHALRPTVIDMLCDASCERDMLDAYSKDLEKVLDSHNLCVLCEVMGAKCERHDEHQDS